MEVHHHPHIEKKNFKEYFLEFIMIFLAVTMGFVAENIRESIIEHRVQKEYLLSFYEDLKTDTARITAVINKDEIKLNGLSHIAECYDSVLQNPSSASCMIKLFQHSTTNFPFRITERTLNQLYNSGGFRLLEKEDADSITRYQSEFDKLENFQETAFQGAQDNLRSIYNTLVNFKANAQMLKPQQRQGILFIYEDVTAPILLSTDKTILNNYFNQLLLYDKVTNGQQVQLKQLLEIQVGLINYFNHKYHFE
ncbi:MAG: hypothetical protein KDC56_05155, partial [Flavobacteriaceae bacterium]|nr:hypothetical protein [Flavobacteriaceae bacterium]